MGPGRRSLPTETSREHFLFNKRDRLCRRCRQRPLWLQADGPCCGPRWHTVHFRLGGWAATAPGTRAHLPGPVCGKAGGETGTQEGTSANGAASVPARFGELLGALRVAACHREAREGGTGGGDRGTGPEAARCSRETACDLDPRESRGQHCSGETACPGE